MDDECSHLVERITELENAIKKHASQERDDRCWADDEELYKVVGIEADTQLPPKDIFLASCKKACEHFWEDRQKPGEKVWKSTPFAVELLQRILDEGDVHAELSNEISRFIEVAKQTEPFQEEQTPR